jgi:membrane protein DedA with SNARE-associated domain
MCLTPTARTPDRADGLPAAFLLYSALGTAIWTAALAYAGVVLQANFTVVGDYINVATNVLLGVGAIMLVRRYIRCWRSTGS